MIDSHCHIHDTTGYEWPWTPEEMLTTAHEAGVTGVICAGTSASDSKVAVDFAARHEMVYALAGVHPSEKSSENEVEAIEEMIKSGGVVGVGEIGLDYHHGDDKAMQKKLLNEILALAVRYDLPVSFHVRDAFSDFWPIYDKFKVRGVLHCFTGTKKDLEEALKRGLYIGITAIAVFSKDEKLAEVLRSVPLDRVLIETDAPFLAPPPHRGKVNQPAYVLEVAKFLAKRYNVSLPKIQEVTAHNTKKLFGL